MAEQYSASTKVYSTENLGDFSILDMLTYYWPPIAIDTGREN